MANLYHYKDFVARNLLQVAGKKLLTHAETIDFLKPYHILHEKGSVINLPAVYDCTNEQRLIFQPVHQLLPDRWVFQLQSKGHSSVIPCGAVSYEGKVLNTDFHRVDIVRDSLTFSTRRKLKAEKVIAPLHHYFGKTVIGYYDYLIFLGAKLCRIKESMPEQAFTQAVLAYPLAKTAYEQEFLQLLGIDQHQVIDSRFTEVQFETCWLGNNQHWTFPDKADLEALKRCLEAGISIKRNGPKRIYISRSVGRRRVNNESALIQMLEKYQFTIIEDKPRTIAEQMHLFGSADFIIGPHGAAFTNLLWCRPNTVVLELFAPGFVPRHFHYFAHVQKLDYHAYATESVSHSQHRVAQDIPVSVSDIEGFLNERLNRNSGMLEKNAVHRN